MVTYRPFTPDDLAAVAFTDATAFGGSVQPDSAGRIARFLELGRTVGAFDDDGLLVGTSAALGWEVTVPGPAVVPAAAVTWVSVLPTHRRQGILTQMMARLLDGAAERGEPLAMLLASESVIYGRFGYGAAARSATYKLEKRHAALLGRPPVPGRLRLTDAKGGGEDMKRIFETVRRQRVGEVSRSDGWWASPLEDRESDRDGLSQLYVAIHDGPQGPDGYVSYRYRETWQGMLADNTVVVREVAAVDQGVRLALLAFVLDLDLVSHVELPFLPVDEPLRWLLVDHRRLRTTDVGDLLWVRILDVERALAARSYSVDGTLVLEVDDRFRPSSSGRYELAVSGGQATCRRVDAEPDLALGVAELGSAYLGGEAFEPMAAAGRVTERRAGVLAQATSMFRTSWAPYCDTDF